MSIFLVTGGAGFIGSHIVEFLIKNSYQVLIVDNFSTGRMENIKEFLGKKCKLIKTDISIKNNLKGIMKDVEIIFHQAALPSVARSIKDPSSAYKANVIGTLNILLEAKKARVSKVIYASSSSVYGTVKKLPAKEDLPPNPLSPYAATKLAGEHLCKIFKLIYQLDVVCLRYFNVFGPKQNLYSQYSAVIPKFINRMLQNKSPIIYGDGTQSRDFTYVYNIVNANILAAKTNTNDEIIFNIASSKPIKIDELINILNTIMKTNLKAKYVNERIGDIKHSYADISKAKNILKYECLISFEEGLKKTIEFYRRGSASCPKAKE